MPHAFRGPLARLMASTSGCAPGCGCDEDRPEPDPGQVRAWVGEAGADSARKALAELERLRSRGPDLRDASRQAGHSFGSASELDAWLAQWESALRAALG